MGWPFWVLLALFFAVCAAYWHCWSVAQDQHTTILQLRDVLARYQKWYRQSQEEAAK
jgi:hypothetical protein